MKKGLSTLKSLGRDWKILAVAGAASFGFVGLVGYFERPPETQVENIDTLIPAGFLLIPIDVQNYESLDSLLGKYGVVDLFKGNGKNGRLVARNIRLLRAPQNPSHFAVLAPESEAPNILSVTGGFYVALKPPNQTGTQIVNSKLPSRRIQFDGD